MSFKRIEAKDFNVNPYTILAKEWMLLTAGNEENGYNTMTISWGHLGSIWGGGGGTPTAVVYVRPQRFTKEFVDREDYFTLSVLDESYRNELILLGRTSGRDGNKIAESGLTPAFENGTTYFKEAKMVLICKKLYHAPLKEEGFIYTELVEKNYPQKDFHEMYVGEITDILIKE